MEIRELIIHNGGKPFNYLEVPSATDCEASALCDEIQESSQFSIASKTPGQKTSRCARPRRPALARNRLSLASYRRVEGDCSLTSTARSETTKLDNEVAGKDLHDTSRPVPILWSEDTRRSTTNCQRLYVAAELLHSEQKYVDMLLMLQTVFIVPLMTPVLGTTAILSPASMSAIFANFIDILHISAELLALLQERLDPFEYGIENSWDSVSGSVGDILCQVGHYFKMYKTYCRNFNSAIVVLETELKNNRRLVTFLSQAHIHHALAGMSLQSYLLLPIQRVPRYKLLVSELTKHTPKDHPDYMSLKEAGLIVSDAARGINEAIRHHEVWQQLLRLQMCFSNLDEPLTTSPSRILLKQGPIIKICRKSHQARELFLFNDCLIVATEVPSLNITKDDSRHFIFNRRFELHALVAELHDQASDSQQYLWRIVSPKKSFLAYNKTTALRSAWVQAIMNAKVDYVAMFSTSRVLLNGESTLQLTHCKVRSQIQFAGLSILAPSFLVSPVVEYPILRNHAAPVWVEDSATTACQRCNVAFSFFRGRHHCRICGQLVCAPCSGKRFLTSSRSEAFRACSSCYTAHFTESVSTGAPRLQDLVKNDLLHLDVPPMNSDTFKRSTRRIRAAQGERLSLLTLSVPKDPAVDDADTKKSLS